MTGHERPAPIAIDDLVEPRFTDEVRGILDLMAVAGTDVDLRPETLMATAADETGLSDFGPGDFVDRLEVLCRALKDEAELNHAGTADPAACSSPACCGTASSSRTWSPATRRSWPRPSPAPSSSAAYRAPGPPTCTT